MDCASVGNFLTSFAFPHVSSYHSPDNALCDLFDHGWSCCFLSQSARWDPKADGERYFGEGDDHVKTPLAAVNERRIRTQAEYESMVDTRSPPVGPSAVCLTPVPTPARLALP